MTVNIYTIGKKKLIGTYNVKSTYESSFYFRNMPTLSAKRCREILNSVSPHYKIESETFVFEDTKTGYTGVQKVHRNGTILNF
jgi:hypothetical protein